MEPYTTIGSRAAFELEERKSRFIAVAAHVESEDEARALLAEVRGANPGARHNVYAWRLRDGGERQSDDGEPSKTSGLPTLEVLRHAGLVDAMVVTTRYFGGTLLGTGGLVRAYTQAAQGALEAAGTVLMSACVDIALDVPYAAYDKVAYAVSQHPAEVLGTDFGASVMVRVRMVEGTQEPLVAELSELLRGEGIVVSAPEHRAFSHPKGA